jgi:DNA (cytosine-5)-methyltransferase 1
MSKLTLGSLFDGSGGFPLGGILCGIKPIWASEIEPFPIRVTTKRIPQMKHYGDITKLNGAELQPVDIITFGSPCTDMSVAGKRAGLDGEQSVLFYEAIRIVREMRCETNGQYPRYIVWENVPGAFSSNNGEDFKAVLEAIINIVQPEAEVPSPKKGRWPYSDIYLGDGWSVAYRTIDAQYFGVAQRRRRIYLVADFGGECAGEILFERKGVSRNFTTSNSPWQRIAGIVKSGSTASSFDGYNFVLDENLAPTVGTNCGISTGRNGVLYKSVSIPQTLKIRSGCEGGGKGALIQVDISATLGCNNDQTLFVPTAFGICANDSNSMKSDNPFSGIYEADTSRALDCNGGNPSCNQGGIAVVALQGSMIGRKDCNGPQGNGVSEDVSFTLNTIDKHAVVYAIDREAFNCGQYFARNLGITDEGISSTLNAQGPSAVATPTYSSSKASFFTDTEVELANTLVATDYKDPPLINDIDGAEYIVRRLTPTECARLQGFPDWWCSDLGTECPTEEDILFWTNVFETHRKIIGTSNKPKTRKQIIKWLREPHSDSAEYKMWGNGVALPCVCFVLIGIVEATSEP